MKAACWWVSRSQLDHKAVLHVMVAHIAHRMVSRTLAADRMLFRTLAARRMSSHIPVAHKYPFRRLAARRKAAADRRASHWPTEKGCRMVCRSQDTTGRCKACIASNHTLRKDPLGRTDISPHICQVRRDARTQSTLASREGLPKTGRPEVRDL